MNDPSTSIVQKEGSHWAVLAWKDDRATAGLWGPEAAGEVDLTNH